LKVDTLRSKCVWRRRVALDDAALNRTEPVVQRRRGTTFVRVTVESCQKIEEIR